MKKRLVILLLTLVLTAGVIWAGSSYFGFVSQTIYEESTAHLTEIFHQANQTLYNLVSVNWSRMRMWEPYLSKTENDEEIATYVNQAREESHFTDFYFISRNGNYLTLEGQRGYLDLREKLPALILSNSRSWSTPWFRISRKSWCLPFPRRRETIGVLNMRPLPSPSITPTWWTR